MSNSARFSIKSPTYPIQRWHTHCSELLRTCRTALNGELANGLHLLRNSCICETWQNTTTLINLLFRRGKNPCTLHTREEGQRRKSFIALHVQLAWVIGFCCLLKCLCYTYPTPHHHPYKKHLGAKITDVWLLMQWGNMQLLIISIYCRPHTALNQPFCFPHARCTTDCSQETCTLVSALYVCFFKFGNVLLIFLHPPQTEIF